jgi:hypothetical protein
MRAKPEYHCGWEREFTVDITNRQSSAMAFILAKDGNLIGAPDLG